MVPSQSLLSRQTRQSLKTPYLSSSLTKGVRTTHLDSRKIFKSKQPLQSSESPRVIQELKEETSTSLVAFLPSSSSRQPRQSVTLLGSTLAPVGKGTTTKEAFKVMSSSKQSSPFLLSPYLSSSLEKELTTSHVDFFPSSSLKQTMGSQIREDFVATSSLTQTTKSSTVYAHLGSALKNSVLTTSVDFSSSSSSSKPLHFTTHIVSLATSSSISTPLSSTLLKGSFVSLAQLSPSTSSKPATKTLLSADVSSVVREKLIVSHLFSSGSSILTLHTTALPATSVITGSTSSSFDDVEPVFTPESPSTKSSSSRNLRQEPSPSLWTTGKLSVMLTVTSLTRDKLLSSSSLQTGGIVPTGTRESSSMRSLALDTDTTKRSAPSFKPAIRGEGTCSSHVTIQTASLNPTSAKEYAASTGTTIQGRKGEGIS